MDQVNNDKALTVGLVKDSQRKEVMEYEIYNGTVQETNKNGNAITKKILLSFDDTPEFWSDIEQK
jgi:hypothetical protein